MEQESCGLCRYLKLDNMDRTVCKRFPKSQSKNNGDWCGEFRIAEAIYIGLDVSDVSDKVAASSISKIIDVQKKRGRPKKDSLIGENK